LPGLQGPEAYYDTGGDGFYGSPAALGLIHWLSQHPRKAAGFVDAGDVYMGDWHHQTMLRLEFELVQAGLL
jgi:hypothetical protein